MSSNLFSKINNLLCNSSSSNKYHPSSPNPNLNTNIKDNPAYLITKSRRQLRRRKEQQWMKRRRTTT
jgi:hypothetical protein